jgi:hypothetical protein
MNIISGLLMLLYGAFHSFLDRPKMAKNSLQLNKQRPRDFEIQCAYWLKMQGYKAERLRFGTPHVAFCGRRDHFVSDDYRRYILVMDAGNHEIGLGRCKRAKAGANVKDIEDFVSALNKYNYSRGWYFSLHGYSNKVYEYVDKLKKPQIILLTGENVLS